MRSTVQLAAAGLKTPKIFSTKNFRILFRRSASTSIPSQSRFSRRDLFRIGKMLCWASRLSSDAPIYQRVGDERLGMRQGSWIGGELMDFRAAGDTIQMLVYRINFANPAADRYSRLALWQLHKTRQEIDAAFKPLNVGGF